MKLRLFYAAGPGDVIGSFECWQAGKADPSEVSATFSGQFYDLCTRYGASGLVIAHRHTGRRLVSGAFRFRERPIPFLRIRSAALYHAGQLWEGVHLAWDAWWFGAHVAIMYGGTHWFMLTLMRMLGIRVVPDLACTLWPTGLRPRGRLQRIIQRLNGWFWVHAPAATLCMSPELIHQIEEVAGPRVKNLLLELPSYQPEYFARIAPPEADRRPFVLLYAGRVERVKGVFDILNMMERLQKARPDVFQLVICGSGSADAALAQAVQDSALANVVVLAGQLTRSEMATQIARSHVVVVPTTAAFPEGLNRVAVEGVLAGRPVLVTSVCPAWELLGEAVVVVGPGDVEALFAAALRLESDRPWYEQKRAACPREASQFYDVNKGWEAAAERALHLALPKLQTPQSPVQGQGPATGLQAGR